jgi:DTW domain-containing protein YfiP
VLVNLEHPQAGRCLRCFLPRAQCVCAEIPTIPTATRFVLIRHSTERYRASNSGRLVAAALPECDVHDYGVRGAPFQESVLPRDAWLLFLPERDRDERLTDRHTILSGGDLTPPPTVILLDGTWKQARKMSRRIAALDDLPRYQVTPTAAPLRRMRRAPSEEAMGTLETVAQFLRTFETEDQAVQLEELYRKFAARLRSGENWGRRAT